MHRQICVLFGVLILSLCAPVRGAQPPSDYERLQPLEWLIGEWVGEYTAPFDLSPWKKGDHVVSYASQRWLLNRSFLAYDLSVEVNGKKTPDTHELAGYDRAGKKLVHWIYAQGGAGSGEWTEVGEKAVLRWSVDLPEGKLVGTSHLQKKDADSYSWQARDVSLGDKKLPDWPEVIMRRRKAEASGDLWKAWRDAIAGSWRITGAISRDFPDAGVTKGDRFVYPAVWTPDADGAFVAGEGTFRFEGKGGVSRMQGLSYWDAHTAQVRLIVCFSPGAVEDVVIQRRQGATFFGTYAIKSPNIAVEREGIRFSFKGPDALEIRFTDGPRKGQLLGSWKREVGK